MALTNGRLIEVDRILNTPPPERLFHYTSPAGIIGIAQSKSLWATHVGFLNDAKELVHAVDLTKHQISQYLEFPKNKGKFSEDEETLLRHMSNYAGRASSAIYVASLTEESDLLSQWRAYCPGSGGYSIGFSSEQLASMAQAQKFFLSPCVYEPALQNRVVKEIIDHHVLKFRSESKEHKFEPKEIENSGVEFARELSRYGSILKHKSFKEEREWRLISLSRGVNDRSIKHRQGKTSVVPYLEFMLVNDQFPNLNRQNAPDSLVAIIGPTSDYQGASFAIQSLGHTYFPPGWGFGRSDTELPTNSRRLL